MGLGWDTIQKYESEELTSELLVVQIVQTSKTAETLIIPSVSPTNQPVLQPTGCANNRKLAINKAGIVLVIVQVCSEAFPSVTTTHT